MREGRHRRVLVVAAVTEIEFWEIAYDYEVYGRFSTLEKAEESLSKQIDGGGPAWRDCEVVRRTLQLPDGYRLLSPADVEKVREGLTLIAGMPDEMRNPDGVNDAVAACRTVADELLALPDGKEADRG